MPPEDAVAGITDRIYEKIVSTCIWVPYEEVYREFLSRLPEYEIHIQEVFQLTGRKWRFLSVSHPDGERPGAV